MGRSGLLTARQQEVIVAAIEGGRPDQYMLPQLLWTRQAVADLAEKRFGVVPALQTVSTWLSDWGFTAKKPVWRVMSENAEAVAVFMTETYPAARAVSKLIVVLDNHSIHRRPRIRDWLTSSRDASSSSAFGPTRPS